MRTHCKLRWGSIVSTCCCDPCPPERLSLGIIYIYREIALGSRLLTPIQLPLVPTHRLCRLFLPAPHCAPLQLGPWGGSLPPEGLCIAAWGRRKSPGTAAGAEARRLYGSQPVVSAKPPLSQDPYLQQRK